MIREMLIMKFRSKAVAQNATIACQPLPMGPAQQLPARHRFDLGMKTEFERRSWMIYELAKYLSTF